MPNRARDSRRRRGDMPPLMLDADDAGDWSMRLHRGMDGARSSLHYSTESTGSGRHSTRRVILISHASPPLKKRFGVEVCPRRIADDRTRDLSLAPKLKAEGKRV